MTTAGGLGGLDLRQLEAILEICRAGSLSGAARRLGVTQPSLSKSIARLEEQLGVRLFDRSGGAAQATEYGRLLAERGRRLLGSAAALRRELQQLASGSGGKLRIGVGPATRLKPLPQVVRELLARYPELQLETLHENGAEIMRGVDEGRYDLAFGYYENASPYGELMRIKLFEDRQVCVATPDHPIHQRQGELAPHELLDHPMASAGFTHEFRRWVGEMTPAERRRAYAFVSDDFGMIRQAAMEFDYVARGPRFVFEEDLARGHLLEAPTTWSAVYECWMVTTETQWQSPIVKAVAEIAKTACAAVVPQRSAA